MRFFVRQTRPSRVDILLTFAERRKAAEHADEVVISRDHGDVNRLVSRQVRPDPARVETAGKLNFSLAAA